MLLAGVQARPYSGPMRLALAGLYTLLGCPQAAARQARALEIKNIQLDSLASHHLLPGLLALGASDDAGVSRRHACQQHVLPVLDVWCVPYCCLTVWIVLLGPVHACMRGSRRAACVDRVTGGAQPVPALRASAASAADADTAAAAAAGASVQHAAPV